MITLYKRGKIFWAESNFHGIRERWSLRTRDKHVAEQLKRAAELDLLGRGRLTTKTWAQFQTEFLADSKTHVADTTLDEYERVLKRFSQFLAAVHIDSVAEVIPAMLTRYAESRRRDVHRLNKRPVSDGGIKYELRILHRAFNFAVECGYLDKNPVLARNLNSAAGRTQPFPQKEIRTLLDSEYLNGKRYLRAIILLFLHTGLRISDVIYLKKSSIANGVLTVKTQKRDTVVRLALHKEVLQALEAMPERKGSMYIFTTDNGRPIVSLAKHLGRLFKKCGIVGGHAHRFRDTFSVRLLEKGATLYDVAKLLGISHRTAELHYSPYCRELQARGAALIRLLDYGSEDCGETVRQSFADVTV